MCGICGLVRKSAPLTESDRAVVRAMTRTLVHRGPDDEGFYFDQLAGLGHRRLSIIDLQGGHQPLTNETRSVWVVYNGEIYNFPELRSELAARGHTFVTRSDTEVIVHGYEEWGLDVATRLRGMFAIALWDRTRRRLVLMRDPIGIKPLFYSLQSDGTLVFGSEIKALLQYPGLDRALHPAALDAYLTLEYIPAPATIFRSIRKLPAGHMLVYQNGQTVVRPYWEVPLNLIPPELRDPEKAVEELRARLADAVRAHLISDVPVGAFLSGGLDSSTVVAWMARSRTDPVRTFSIGLEDASYNELPYARMVAEAYQTEHIERILPYDAVATVERLVDFLDEPFGDFSIFPTYLVARTAREHVKVILSGDGGDEIFAGYEHYIAWKIDRWLRTVPWPVRRWLGHAILRWCPPSPVKKGFANRLLRFAGGWTVPDVWQHVRFMMFLNARQKALLYHPDLVEALRHENVGTLMAPYFERAACAEDPLNAQLYLDLKTYLPEDILVKVDRMSMAVSLETRVPLLDPGLVAWMARLPGVWKLRRFQTKWLLKRAMAPLLPRPILHREKQGFSIPMKNWLRQELRPFLFDHLNAAAVARHGLFRWPVIERWVREHLDFRADHAHRLWALLMFQVWYDKYLTSGAPRPPQTGDESSATRAKPAQPAV